MEKTEGKQSPSLTTQRWYRQRCSVSGRVTERSLDRNEEEKEKKETREAGNPCSIE